MLFISKVIAALEIITIHGYFCFGIPGDRGLVLGIWNPASLATITEIPRAPASYFTNVSKSLNPSNAQITSIASDERNKIVFIAVKYSIYAFHKFNIWQNESKTFTISLAYERKSAGFGQITFDYVSNNLYWCDSLLNWIAMKPAYGQNNSIYRIVVQDDLYQPEGLTLDSEDGLMFFSDNDLNPRIEKASMDGKNRTVIVHTSLIRILALSVDTVNDLLYWADSGRQTVEVSHFDGSNRRVLRRNNQVSLTGIHYHQNILHAASAGSKQIFGFDVKSGSVLYKLTMATVQPFAVHVYDAETQISYADPCSSRRCQHMCVNTPAGATCLCAEGYQLSTDGSSCRDPSWFHNKGFIVSNATAFSMLEVNSVNGRPGRVSILKVPFSIIETFAVDPESDLIYFVDSVGNMLKELNIITRQIKTLASIENATDLNFDWIANLLEWIEPAQSTIRAFSINSGTTSVIYSGLQQPTSLTVDSHNGYLFWLSGRTQISIMRGTLSRGLAETIVTSANLHHPSSLYYDVTSNRIYWVDRSIIKSCMTNGSDIKSHVITLGATQAFAYKDFFGWINADKIFFTRKSSISRETALNIVQNAKHVSIFDSSLQQDRRGGCHILNGGCEDICVPSENGRKCECDIGLQLQSDLKTCDSSAYSTNFLLVSDYSHGRILQVDISTGNIVKLPIIVKTPPGMTFDKLGMELIYSVVSSKTIMSTTLHGMNTSLVYATGFAHAERLTIDYSTGNIYYTAEGSTPNQSYIGVVHRVTLHHRTLFSNMHSPRDIVVYPSKGFLYWTEFGNITEIGRSYMDGTSKKYIATTDIGWPNGLAIDFISNRLYWTDGLRNRIEYSDLNGGNRQVLTTDNDAHLMSIVIHGQYLYYTAWNRQRITKINKATGSKVTFMTNHPELGRLDSLDIYSGDSVDVSRICSKNNGGCSTFCFPTPTGRTCGCQDNVNLQADQKTCQGVSRCDTSLQNIDFPDCLPYPGQNCQVACKSGYRLVVNASVTCDQSGHWTPSPSPLCTEIFCTSVIDNALLSSECTRKAGESCTFSCNNGYTSTTSGSLLCTNNGTWSQDTKNLCLRSGCSKTIKNGHFINCQSKIGETCRYECSGLLKVNPSVPNVTCYESGDWSHDANDLCVRLCSSSIQNGKLDKGCQRKIGNVCSYTCDPNYRSSISSLNIVCTLDGAWNENTDEICKPSGCSKTIPNGQLINCQSNIQETCQYICYSPLEINPSVPNVTCNGNGKWSDDTNNLCVHLCPSTIRNGKLDEGCQRNIGNICSYSCDINYRSSMSSSNIVCTLGATWNENTDGLCKSSGCSKTIQNGKLITCQANIRETCGYECNGLFEVNSLAQNVTCNENGEWSHDVNDLCIRACPSTIRNGKLDKGCPRKIGNICSFSCDINYSSSLHSSRIVCTSNGTWNENTNKLCKPPGCPKTIQNGKLINCSSNSGEICGYECIDPFYINPLVPTVTCNTGGDWSHATSNLCVRPCPSIIPHGKLASNCERQIGDRCSFICNSNYQSSIPSTNIVCTSDSTWNEDIDKICKRITCPLQIPDGFVSSQCNGNIGEICEVVCRNESNATSLQLICTSLGSWNKDINNICTQFTRNISSHHATEDSFDTYVFIGASIAGLIVIAIVATVCFLKKRNTYGNRYERSTVQEENNYLTISNQGYLTENNSAERQLSAEYFTINDQFASEQEQSPKQMYLNPVYNL
ncbi:low-density lipoprotein receptor-related protein 2-like [Saccostrea echinata]|uniref:low-density lipoprotein receptor-related protein 2-like n=1 Tax=Saccostrea echinata TaxID=191078 RepID=UPI002A821C10|nr:low-density lipoprotein receptor-related protein 2-like [Saccostrea echinata]